MSAFAFALAVLTLAAASAQAQTVTLSIHSFIDATGTVTSSPAGINCTTAKFNPVGECSATFPVGTVVTLTAAPGEQNTFEGWTGVCMESGSCNVPMACAGTASCQVTLTQDFEVWAHFVATRYPVTIVAEGNGEGVIRETPGQTFGTPPLVCVIRNGQVQTSGFSVCTTTVAYNSDVSLGFDTNIAGTNRLDRYSSECALQGTGRCSARITGPTTITATVVAAEFRVKSAGGTGTGIVTSNVTEINCSVTSTGVTGGCVKTYTQDTPLQVTLIATPAEGSRFVGWSGACTSDPCTLFPDYPPNVPEAIALFEALPENTVKLVVNGIGGYGRGHVTSSPAGIDCDFSDPAKTTGTGTCLATFRSGTTVELTASPRDGTKVLGFTGDCVSQATTCTVIMYHDRTATVQLDPARFPVTIVASGNGSGRVFGFLLQPDGTGSISCIVSNGVASATGCTANFPLGSTASFLGGFEDGSRFVGFSVPPCAAPTSCTVAVTGPLSITATFELVNGSPIALTIAGVGTGRGIVTAAPASTQCSFNGVLPDNSCTVTYAHSTQVTLTASPQFGSTFAGWTGDACSSTELTCTFTLSAATTVSVNFISPHSAHDLGLALIGGATLSPNDRAGFDRLGNQNGVFDLGDLLAFLDRTGQKLTATEAAAVMAAPPAPSAARTTRRVP